jgi:hypothetical protein
MELIKWDSLKEDTAINESLATMGRQLWDSIKNTFDTESWCSDRHAYQQYMASKRKYFNELFTISDQLKKKMVMWCSQVPGALALSKGELHQMMNAMDTEKHTSYNTYNYGNGYSGSYAHDYETSQTKEVTLQRKARTNNGVNSITNATCSYILDAGNNKAYLLYITFDSDEIKRVQVVCKNKYSKGGSGEGLDIEELRQFRTVNPAEYRK